MRGISGKEWVFLWEEIEPPREWVERYGKLGAQILANRGLKPEDLSKNLSDLLEYSKLEHIKRAADVIAWAIKNGKRIVLFGDYDVDGITSCALLHRVIKKLGGKVISVTPNRSTGYGLSKDLVQKLNHYADLVVTLDNGTTAIEELSLAKVPVLVLDHHNPREDVNYQNLSEKVLLVNPKLLDIEELKVVSTAALSMLLSYRLIGDDLMDYLYLPALSTVADAMELVGLNRPLVLEGIKSLKETLRKEGHYGIKELLKVLKDQENITVKDLSFYLVPRLNAPGRLHRAELSLKLLLEDREKEAARLVRQVESINLKRRQLQEILVNKALKKVEMYQTERHFIVLKTRPEYIGLAGIVAGRVANAYSKPCAVFAVGKEEATASVRGTPEVEVYNPLSQLSHMYLKWGGHAYAMGLTIWSKDLQEFETKANEIFSQVPRKTPTIHVDAYLPLRDLSQEHIRLIESLEPFGVGFEEPIFLSEELTISNIKVTGYGCFVDTKEGYSFYCANQNLVEKLRVGRARVLYSLSRKKHELVDLAWL